MWTICLFSININVFHHHYYMHRRSACCGPSLQNIQRAAWLLTNNIWLNKHTRRFLMLKKPSYYTLCLVANQVGFLVRSGLSLSHLSSTCAEAQHTRDCTSLLPAVAGHSFKHDMPDDNHGRSSRAPSRQYDLAVVELRESTPEQICPRRSVFRASEIVTRTHVHRY
jgi:hypothetical protein